MRRLTLAVDIDGTVTEDGAGRVHLDALSRLRHMSDMGHNVVFVSGRSSVEAYLLSVFGGTAGVAVGENGGCITTGPSAHVLLGDRAECVRALGALRPEFAGMREKPVFPRMTEVVLERTFDIGAARGRAAGLGLGVSLSDSGYAFHINSRGVDKGSGLRRALGMLGASRGDAVAIGDGETDVPMFGEAGTSVALANAPESVKGAATMVAGAAAGDGVVEALDTLAPALAGGRA